LLPILKEGEIMEKILKIVRIIMVCSIITTLMIFAGACTGDDDDDDSGSVVGTWQRHWQGLLITAELRADMTYTVSAANNYLEILGVYTHSGNQFTFQDTGGAESCPSDEIGTYTYSLAGDEITLVLVTDACAGRADVLVGVWTRN